MKIFAASLSVPLITVVVNLEIEIAEPPELRTIRSVQIPARSNRLCPSIRVDT